MADELISKLGFDASDATKALESMDQKMAALEGRFGSLASAMSAWNSSAASTISVLKELATYANSAASAMGKLNANMNKGGGGSAAAPPPPPEAAKPGSWLPPGVKEEYDKMGQAGAQAGQKVAGGASQAGGALEGAKGKAGGFTVSLQMLSRIVITQAIVRALSGIRDAFSEAITANMEFVKRMSELNALFDGPHQSMADMSAQVAELAKQFNFPIGQVVEAEYQAVSAQFVNAADRASVMTAAMKLAKVGCMELSTSVSLITTALNSYGMSASQADTVAGKFFQTIRDGKVRGEEIAASLGKVVPVAAELGVSLETVTTAIVQMTVEGVKAPEAATSIRSAMMAMIKPTAELTKEMHALGYANSEQMIAGNNLIGTLNLLRESEDGSIAAAVKMIPNVRAQAAVLTETQQHAKATREELEKMNAAGAESLNKAYKVYIDTDAEKASSELNKLQVWLTTDFGKTLLEAVANIMRFVGGVGTITSAISALAGPLVTGGALIAGYAIGMKLVESSARSSAAAIAAKTVATQAETVVLTENQLAARNSAAAHELLRTALGGAAAVVGSGLAIWAAYNFAINKFQSDLEQAETEYLRVQHEMSAEADKTYRDKINTEDKANEAIIQAAVRRGAEINKTYFKEVDEARDKNQARIADEKNAMESMVSVRERQSAIFRDVAREDEKEIKDSFKRTAADRSQAADLMFSARQEQEYKQANPEKNHDTKNDWLFQKQQREDEAMAANLARQGETKLSNAKSPEDESEAQGILKRAESYGQMAKTAAGHLNDVNAEKEAEGAILHVIQQKIDAEGRFRQVKQAQAKEAGDMAAKEKAIAEEMRVEMKAYLKETSLFDKKDQPLTAKERAEKQEKANAHFQKFQDLALESNSIDATSLLNFASLRQKLADAAREGITEVQIKNIEIAPEALAKLNAQLSGGIGSALEGFKKLAPDMDFSKIAPQDYFDAVIKHLQEAKKTSKEWKDIQADVADETRNIADEQGRIPVLLEAQNGKGISMLRGFTQMGTSLVAKALRPTGDTPEEEQRFAENSDTTKVNEKLAKFQEDIAKKAISPETITPDVIKGFGERFKELKEQSVAFGPDIKNLQTMLTVLENISKLQEQINAKRLAADKANAEGHAQAGQENLEKLGKDNDVHEKAVNAMIDRQANINSLFAMADAETAKTARNIEQGAAGLERQAAAAQQLQQAQAGNAPGGQASNATPRAQGGAMWQWLADGGHPRGRDTIHAMLSPGEMVINERSARKFGAQLTAMNAGTRPNYHSHGGSVTNVGDINVHVAGGNSASGTGRQIASELRRELRRGSSTL